MKIRKIHRSLAIVYSPLFIILAISGCMLLFRKTGIYGEDTKSFLVSLHTWEIIASYIGLVIGLGLLVISITGIILYFNKRA
jgi:uncharacterized iron-regulated membrane protein